MEYRRLGRTDLQVSLICLGTMTWGEQNTKAEAFEQMDYALDQGINFFDTAEMYAVPPRRETYGLTESYIGDWFAERKNRDKVILATKVVGRAPHMTWIRDGGARLDRANIEAALDASLKRLKTDYVDLYQLHWPDRDAPRFGVREYRHGDDSEAAPIAETLQVLGDLVRAGKIRHVGLSNETPWGVMTFLRLAEQMGLPRMASVQNPYNLLNRIYELGLAEVSLREDCGLLAYSPLAAGTLTGKYLNGQLPAGTRRAIDSRRSRYDNPRADRATAAYVELARRHGLDPARMALAYVNSRSFVTANIIGATSMAQLKADVASVGVKLSQEILDAIEAIHWENPDPAP